MIPWLISDTETGWFGVYSSKILIWWKFWKNSTESLLLLQDSFETLVPVQGLYCRDTTQRAMITLVRVCGKDLHGPTGQTVGVNSARIQIKLIVGEIGVKRFWGWTRFALYWSELEKEMKVQRSYSDWAEEVWQLLLMMFTGAKKAYPGFVKTPPPHTHTHWIYTLAKCITWKGWLSLRLELIHVKSPGKTGKSYRELGFIRAG